MESLKVVRVRWVDAETSMGWESISDISATVPTVTSVGFLVADSDTCIIIASTIGAEFTDCNSRIAIPLGMIVDLEELNVDR